MKAMSVKPRTGISITQKYPQAKRAARLLRQRIPVVAKAAASGTHQSSSWAETCHWE